MILTIIGIVVVLALVILSHELGHFLLARKNGIIVEVFSFGFGPKLFSFHKGETEYKICLFPLGGYVKLSGEEGEKEEVKKGDYFFQPPGKRAAVIFAGPFSNLLFGLILFIPAFIIGISILDIQSARVGEVLHKSPAEFAVLKKGDEVISIEGKSVENWEEMTKIIHKSSGKSLNFLIKRENKEFSLKIIPEEKEVPTLKGEKEKVGLIGITPGERLEKYSFPGAVRRSFYETGKIIFLIFLSLKKMITGEISGRNLVGPVGIVQLTGQIVHLGFSRFLYFIAFISINLGIVNLFPFPILDGGHLFGLLGERVIGRKPSKRFLEVCQTIGFLCLILLFFFITYNDILRLFHK